MLQSIISRHVVFLHAPVVWHYDIILLHIFCPAVHVSHSGFVCEGNREKKRRGREGDRHMTQQFFLFPGCCVEKLWVSQTGCECFTMMLLFSWLGYEAVNTACRKGIPVALTLFCCMVSLCEACNRYGTADKLDWSGIRKRIFPSRPQEKGMVEGT